jgi:hypothetical protein
VVLPSLQANEIGTSEFDWGSQRRSILFLVLGAYKIVAHTYRHVALLSRLVLCQLPPRFCHFSILIGVPGIFARLGRGAGMAEQNF